MAYLNGVLVSNEVISPHKHNFIGMFRTPDPPGGPGYIQCSCGEVLQDSGNSIKHWLKGHFDTPVYEDKGPPGEGCS